MAKVKTANRTERNDRLPDFADAHGQGWRDSVNAALDWWRDAGVDHAFIDDPQNWLAEAQQPGLAPLPVAPLTARAAPAESRDSPALPRVGDRAGWPQTLAEFAPWWMSEPALAPAGLNRLAPLGEAQADLLVLVPMPSADDATQLLDGRAGKLLDAMLAAFALDRSRVYIASALPAHLPMPDWQACKAAGLGEVLLHHLALAAPKRVLILGTSGISTLLGHDPPNLAHSLRAINQEGPPTPVLPAWDLEAMLQRPALKAGLWSRWLEWTGIESH